MPTLANVKSRRARKELAVQGKICTIVVCSMFVVSVHAAAKRVHYIERQRERVNHGLARYE